MQKTSNNGDTAQKAFQSYADVYFQEWKQQEENLGCTDTEAHMTAGSDFSSSSFFKQ